MAKNALDFWRGGALSQWSPFREVRHLRRNIDRMFEDVLNPVEWDIEQPMRDLVSFQPSVDVDENQNQFVMTFDVPGLGKDDIHIELRDGNRLVVWGERKEEKHEEQGRRIRERSYGMFERVFTLPSNVNPDQIEANYENGVLCLTLPKTQVAKPKQIQIGGKKLEKKSAA